MNFFEKIKTLVHTSKEITDPVHQVKQKYHDGYEALRKLNNRLPVKPLDPEIKFEEGLLNGRSKVDFKNGIPVITIQLQQSKEKPWCIDHEIGHALEYSVQNSQRKSSFNEQEASKESVREYLFSQSISELIAMLYEYISSPEKNSHFEYRESAQEEKGKFPGFEIFYSSPSHALGHELLERLLQHEKDKKKLHQILAKMIEMNENDIWKFFIELVGENEIKELNNVFIKNADIYYKEMF